MHMLWSTSIAEAACMIFLVIHLHRCGYAWGASCLLLLFDIFSCPTLRGL